MFSILLVRSIEAGVQVGDGGDWLGLRIELGAKSQHEEGRLHHCICTLGAYVAALEK